MKSYRRKLTYENTRHEFELGKEDYIADLYARADFYHCDGCSHMKNGDLGYPDENDLEITDFKIRSLKGFDEDGNEVEVTDKKVLDDAEYELCVWLGKNIDKWSVA